MHVIWELKDYLLIKVIMVTKTLPPMIVTVKLDHSTETQKHFSSTTNCQHDMLLSLQF